MSASISIIDLAKPINDRLTNQHVDGQFWRLDRWVATLVAFDTNIQHITFN